ncbi:MAG TPA: PPC domain-containing DNA-binding protein [Candidatus Nanoarchaeia archaeon]|nr:PPC domain-containing DNA-binding protein [Candidatus Nanoarchaeia archaeon]
MNFKKINDTFIVRLDSGERVLETLKGFCTKNNIKCGYFFGIGSLDEVELAHYIVRNKKYTFNKYRQPLEIVNLSGNITTMNDGVYLHCHITLGDVEMEVIAGHLKEGIVGATAEIVVIKLDGEINRKYDEKTGLNLMDL